MSPRRVDREAAQAALRRVATVVAREADLAEIGRVVAQEAAILLGADSSAVYRFVSETEATCHRLAPARSLPASPAREPVALSGGDRHRPHRAHPGEAARVDDYGRVAPDDSITEVLGAGLRSAIATPLRTRGRLWRPLAAGSSRAGAFTASDERRLADFASSPPSPSPTPRRGPSSTASSRPTP